MIQENHNHNETHENGHNTTELFILSDHKKVTFSQPFQKVLGFCPMFNDTFVVMAIKSNRVECVAHLDAQGKIIKQHTFHDSNLYPFVITSEREIIWLDSNLGLILQWNLQTNILLQFPFLYLDEAVAQTHQLFIFPQTNMFCVGQWGNEKSNEFRLTYYHYPLNRDSQPVHVYQSDQTWSYEYCVRRGNVRSMIIWFKSQHKQTIEFKTFELGFENGGKQPKFTHHKVLNPIANQINRSVSEISIGNIWQMIPYKFMLITITDRPKLNNEYPNSIFVYEQNTHLFRQSLISLPPQYRVQYVDYFSMGTTSMIKTFSFYLKSPQESPTYFLDNATQSICATENWKCSHLNKYTFPAYDANMVIDARYENGNVKEIYSESKKVVRPQELTVNMLGQVIGEGVVEEDLLAMVVGLLY